MTRQYLPARVEWKAAADDSNTLEGYASVFGVTDLHGDVVKKGAFKKTIKERVNAGRVKLLDSHVPDASHVVGTITEAKEDQHGLRIKAKLSSAPSVQDLRTKLVEGHLEYLSIGYSTVRESWHRDDEADMIRHLEELKLYEVSVVPFPANEEAAISAVKEAIRVAGSGLVEAPADERKEMAEELSDALGGVFEEPVTLVVGRTSDEVKSALGEPGEAKILSQDLHRALSNAGRERYGDDDRWVFVEDIELDEQWVVLAISSDSEEMRWVRVSYTREGDDVTLGDDEEDVEVVTEYEPKSADDDEVSRVEPADERPPLDEIMRRSKALLGDRDPDEVAEPAQVASLTTRLDLAERSLSELLPEDEELIGEAP